MHSAKYLLVRTCVRTYTYTPNDLYILYHIRSVHILHIVQTVHTVRSDIVRTLHSPRCYGICIYIYIYTYTHIIIYLAWVSEYVSTHSDESSDCSCVIGAHIFMGCMGCTCLFSQKRHLFNMQLPLVILG